MNAPLAIQAPRPRLRRSDERALHIAAVAFLRRALPPEVIVFHAPNGEHRDKRTAQKLKAFGTLAGVPDLTFVLAAGQVAFVEFKAKGGYLSPAQREFRDRAVTLGAVYAECRSLEDLEEILTERLGLKLRARLT